MNKAAEYRQYAAECRLIAEALQGGEQQTQLRNIAAEWEMLANDAAKRFNQFTDAVDPKISRPR